MPHVYCVEAGAGPAVLALHASRRSVHLTAPDPALAGANRNDPAMLEPTLDAVAAAGLLADIGTLYLDRATTPAPSATGSEPMA
jgi:hypothetical protein